MDRPHVATIRSSPRDSSAASVNERRRISLGIGAVVVVDAPTVVRTVLGSCIAAIFHVPRLRVSAVCHAQMPEPGDGLHCDETCPHPCRQRRPSDTNDLKYVTCCIRYMLDELEKRGVGKSEIVCTLVGGANVVRNIDLRWSVAGRNVTMAKRVLAREGINIRYEDTGGSQGRVIEHTNDLNQTKVRYHESTA